MLRKLIKLAKAILSQRTLQIKIWYHVPKNTLYHDLICLIISQRISFNLGRQIRQKLRAEHEKICRETILRADIVKQIDLKAIGISNENLRNCINAVTTLELNGKLKLEAITNLKGIGDWTYKSLLVMGHSAKGIESSEKPKILKLKKVLRYFLRKMPGPLST